jgi:hypothetical protein
MLFPFVLLCVFADTTFAQQWQPTTSSTTIPIRRAGAVGVGLTVDPTAMLHVSQTITTDGPGGPSASDFASLRLERSIVNFGSGTTNHKWDFLANDGLQIVKTSGATTIFGLGVETNALNVGGNRLVLGYGAGTTQNDNMTLGYTTGGGHHILFNGTYGSSGAWQGPNGKTVIESESDGSLRFLTQAAGGVMNNASRRLTITPQGTTVVGEFQDAQVLQISANENSILRFNRNDQALDYEILANNEGHIEFRGGSNGEGAALPTLMKLKYNGKLAIGTDLTPNSLGGANITNYKLYVEGGILTKEVRVRTSFADYVFCDDYNLLSLAEVENQYRRKGPSAQHAFWSNHRRGRA